MHPLENLSLGQTVNQFLCPACSENKCSKNLSNTPLIDIMVITTMVIIINNDFDDKWYSGGSIGDRWQFNDDNCSNGGRFSNI